MNTESKDKALFHTLSIDSPGDMDLTSPKWMLKEGQFSEILGLDVVTPGRFQRARGRLPLGVSLNTTLTEVQEFNIQDIIPTRYTGIVAPQYSSTSYSTPFYEHFHAEDDVTYSSNTGALTPNSLDFYVDRNSATGISIDAHDRDDLKVLIKSPPSLRGVHQVTATSPATSITIAPGLAPAFSFVSDVEGLIAEGEGLYGWDNHPSTPTEWWIVKSPKLYAKEGPFPSEAQGAVVLVNADSRNGSYKTGAVASVETFAQSNDALKMTTDLGLMTNGNHKIRVIFYKERSLQGALVTNGRKFWLLSNGEYELKLDLGSDSYLLTQWRAARIARNRILLVSPTQAPRILKLDRETSVTEDDSLAGIPSPKKPPSVETITNDLRINPSWLVALDASGDITGSIQVLVRAANYEDSVYSELIPAVLSDNLTISSEAETGTTSAFLTIPFAGDFGGVFPNSNNDDSGTVAGFTPPISPRANHIEVWRTPTGQSIFYREAILDINARAVGNETSDDGDYRQWFDPTPSQFPIRLSNADLQRLTILTANDRDSGGLPPFCKDVVSLNDVTVCFGKASEDRTQPIIYSYNWFTVSAIYDPSDGDVTFPTDQRTEALDNYVWKTGDELVVTYGGMDSTGAKGHLAEGTYSITQKTDANELRIASGLTTNIIGSAGNFALIHCCIRRPYTVEYPAIESDEDVWYSRTDTFGPENFPARTKILSRTGDIFRRAIVVGDQIVVVMDQGVHLLYFSGTELLKETVAISGWGTPWKNSVIAYGDKVYWATNDSIVELSLSVNPGVDGRRTHLQRIGKLQYESWFRDALESGDAVDAGVDVRNGTMRFRREKSDGNFQSLELSFLTGKVTLHDDDSGFRYFNSYTVEEPNSDRPYFYSIDSSGRVFREHNQNLTDHYSGKILESSLGEPWIVGATYIRHPSQSVFSELMVGEILRINDDIIRTINTAGPKEITFDTVTEPITSFKIAPVRFRLKPAPVTGSDKNSDKTLHSLEIKLRPGDTDAPNTVTVKGYGDLTNLDSSGTIPVYHDRERTSDDRSSGIEAHGQSVEIELESLDTRNDFQIESIVMVVKEENFSTVS